MDHFQNDVRVMERCCRCLRFAIRAVGKSGIFVLKPLVEKVGVFYWLKKMLIFRVNDRLCLVVGRFVWC